MKYLVLGCLAALALEVPAGAVGDTPSSETPTESTRDLGAD
jgi:hypothetical protein